MKKLYAAYGSNLNLVQMKHRCPTARLIGTGLLNDYELQFRGQPDHSFATVEPKKGGSVPVGLWEIRSEDEDRLDLYEGFPLHYSKQQVPVSVNGIEITAMLYRMTPGHAFGRPSTGYYHTVRQGYLDCSLDVRILNRAVERSAMEYDRLQDHRMANPEEKEEELQWKTDM